MPPVENNKLVWSQRKVLVTGGSGFLGSWLILRLVQYGAEVVGIVRGDNQNSLLSKSADQYFEVFRVKIMKRFPQQPDSPDQYF